ncbi:kinase-associated lipoprotein B [Halobacillus andaensis]|uniref:Kinase-associated lipoprotein B n=1 Tax=Halobacillus andaensis TaxID=1176239 RepID=A0A917B9D6_HALAA|nr:sporulation phosphorelay system protein KapB [Halobacillus andaensis]MBP2005599.1 kinase-associated protein B [Halobacillus andaensis]GGF32758.1 kinase-associated lipoprotein B [Halobacillus andaensis]
MTHLQPGDTVKAHYKTGIYIGEYIEERPHAYLVKILAVDKHPMQGDLHNPGQTDEVFFHQRKALSYLEKANIHKKAVEPLGGQPVPEYTESLKKAVDQLKEKLNRRETEFNKLALDQVESLEKQYFK